MTFGPEHQNVRNATVGAGNLVADIRFHPPERDDPELWTSFLHTADLNAQRLQRILDAVSAPSAPDAPRGGTVFFPPGRYYLGRSGRTFAADQTTDAPDILVPRNVTLEFAPGAVLVPVNLEPAHAPRTRPASPAEDHLVIVEVQGAIKAGLHEIFASTLYPRPADDIPANQEPPHRAGKVVFTGDQVREVYPEWWGVLTQFNGQYDGARGVFAGGHWGVRNRRAFQAAIDAGHTDRYRLVRDETGAPSGTDRRLRWRQESTIPVVAMYEYYIEGGLRVGHTTDGVVNPAPFVLRGGCEPSRENTTLLAMVDPSRPPRGLLPPVWADSPMLTLEGVSSFALEGVSFDGNHLVRQVVALTTGEQGGFGRFERCVFKNLHDTAGATLVTIRTPRRGATAPAEPVHLAFTACRLTPMPLNHNPTGTLPGRITYAERLRALLLDHDDDCSIELRACHLQGVCDPMIHARRGRFALNECVFHGNRSTHTAAPTPWDPDSDWRRFWNSTSGTDIFIDRPRTVAGGDDAPASFTARELESQSFQFVSTWMEGDPPAERRDGPPSSGSRTSYVLINAHHTAAPAGSSESDRSQGEESGGGADPHPFPVEQFRPSVSWEGPGQVGCHLVALGCCFKSTYPGAMSRTSAELGGVRLGPNHTGTIFHLANTTADPDHPLNLRGPFRNALDGVAPRAFIRWAAAPGGIREPFIVNLDVEPVR